MYEQGSEAWQALHFVLFKHVYLIDLQIGLAKSPIGEDCQKSPNRS